MGDIIKMIIVLTATATIIGTVLSFMERTLKEPIEYSTLKFVKGPAVLSVLANCENDPLKDLRDVNLIEKSGLNVVKRIFPAKRNGKIFAVAFEVLGKGYGGVMAIMIGINLRTGQLTGMRVMTHSETPGLGARCTEPLFYEQFSGLGIKDTALKEKGGKIDAISGATNTSQSVVESIKKALELLTQNKEKIIGSFRAT